MVDGTAEATGAAHAASGFAPRLPLNPSAAFGEFDPGSRLEFLEELGVGRGSESSTRSLARLTRSVDLRIGVDGALASGALNLCGEPR